VNADYVAQGRIGRFNNNLTIKVELYDSKKGNLISSFTGESKDIAGLRDIINEKAADLFKKMLDESSGKIAVPSFAEGIVGVQIKGSDYEFAGEKRYLANISSEPEGAILSFNGVPSASCKETPCKAELREGSVRIIANLNLYDIADTTVSIKQNNQNIRLRLKANFGVLDIKPAYLDDIGRDERWSLTINGNAAYSWENRLSPNKYKVELSHWCYESINFGVGINRDKREVFDMASHIKLKKGGLVLSAEADGELVSEPVFVNGKRVGETPFSGSVPVCAEVEIGSGREYVNVKIKYNESVKYTHDMDTREKKRRLALEQEAAEREWEQQKRVEQQAKREAARREFEKQEREKKKQEELAPFKDTRWALGGGGYLDVENIDPEYSAGGFFFLNAEFVSIFGGHLRFGADVDFGVFEIEKSEEKIIKVYNFRGGPSTKLSLGEYHWLYLSGGASWYTNKSHFGPLLSVGGGIRFRFFLDAQYNIMPTDYRNVRHWATDNIRYWTLRGGFSLPL